MSNKKSVSKFRQTRRKAKPEISELEHKFNCERVTDLIMQVYERMPKDNIQPVKESFDELLDQLKTGGKRAPVIVNHLDGSRIRYNQDGTQERLISGIAGSVAVPIPESNTSFESTAEDENSTAKMVADVRRERFEKSSQKNFTAIDSSDAEKSNSAITKDDTFTNTSSVTFTESEKLLLEQYKK